MKLKKIASAAMAAVLSVAMLTACSGGGGGGTGGGGTAIKPVEFKSTKTYKIALAQESENKSFYAEYWLGSNSSGTWVENKDSLVKSGSQDGATYSDYYWNGAFFQTILHEGQKTYVIVSPQAGQYKDTVQFVKEGGAEVPEGQAVYYDSQRVHRETTGGDSDGGEVISGIGQLKESDVVATTGTYRGYYAEIFTWKTDPKKSITVAYDENDEVKAQVFVDHDSTTAFFYNKYEFDSPSFVKARLSLSYYNAVDVTDAYIAAWNKARPSGT